MTTRFEDRLRADLVDALPAHRRRRRRRDRAVAVVGAAVVVFAVGVGVGGALDDRTVEQTDTGPATTAVPPPSTSPTSATAEPAPSTSTSPTTTEPPTTTNPPTTVVLDPASGLVVEPTPVRAVTRFLDALGGVDGPPEAAARWTGYPEVLDPPGAAAVAAAKADVLAALLAANPWVVDPDATIWVGETAEHPGVAPEGMVTVVVDTPEGLRAMAFVTAALGGGHIVDRVPTAPYEVPISPVSGSTVAPGDTVALLVAPVEGGVRAYVDGDEVPAAFDPSTREVRVTIPEDATGEVAVTISVATPEVAAAVAATYVVAG